MKNNKMKKILFIVLPTILFLCILGGGYNYIKYVGFASAKSFSETKYSYHTEQIDCINDQGQTIYGVAYIPEGTTGTMPVVIVSHGFNSTYNANKLMCKSLAMSGIASYAYDFRGGSNKSKSDGKTTDMSVFTEQEDLNNVIDMVKKWDYVDPTQLYLFGESQGGYVSAITAAQRNDEIKGLLLLYPAFVLSENLQYDSVNNIPETQKTMGMTISRVYYENLLDYNIYDVIGNYKGDVEIFHGDSDKVVDLSYSERAINTYLSAKLHVFPGEQHGFTAPARLEVAGLVYDYLIAHK
jgi:dipeptidyl aminopeptidase/acylaminoacyl peptidase